MTQINVVYTGKGRGDVLDRLAGALAQAGGWAYNRYPLDGWDWNHFICYVEYGEKFSDWRGSRVSAWFTHLEENREYKRFWWELAAQNADLRITAAQQYARALSTYGPTAVCAHPAVDGIFVPQKRRSKGDVLRIGVAGYVHPGGRKGERLVAKLCGSDLVESGRAEVVASGMGWPCRCQEYAWSEMPGFYNSLDVLLCTSTVEGVPMPPLEALACGVKIVIPRGVGLLDNLPDLPGIERYEAGNYAAMYDAVLRALDVRADRDALREAVSGYTAAAWASEHAAAFAQQTSAIVTRESDRHGKRGVLYIAYGEPSRRCAEAAIASFRRFMPGVEVVVVSTEPLGVEDVFVRCDDVDIGGRYAKTRIYDLAPHDWQYILYLDADTEIVADISFLYDVLTDGWDMVICKNPAKYHAAREMRRSDNHDECEYTFAKLGTSELVQLNGGVFAFQRNQRTQNFFAAWHEEWQRYGKRDQGALLRALFRCPVKLYVLGNEWNTITRYQDASTSAGILHYPMTARRWRGKVTARSDSPEAWAAVRQFAGG